MKILPGIVFRCISSGTIHDIHDNHPDFPSPWHAHPKNMIHRGFPPSLPSSNHFCIDVIQFNTIHDHSCTVYSYHTLQSYSHFTPIIIIIYHPWPTIFFAGGGAPRANPRASAEAGRSWSQRGGHKPTCPQKLLPPHCLGPLFQIIFEWHDI